jgi:hypothetical protein
MVLTKAAYSLILAGKKFKRKECGKMEEIQDFSSIDPYKAEMMQEGEFCLHLRYLPNQIGIISDEELKSKMQ